MLSESKQSGHTNHSQKYANGTTYHVPLGNNEYNEYKLSSDPNKRNLKLTNKQIDIICVPNIKPSKHRRKQNRRAKTLDADSATFKNAKRIYTNSKGSMTPKHSPKMSPRPISKKKSKKSKLRLMGVRAKMKLTNTISTDQPQAIINAKRLLKNMKRFFGTDELEHLATNLYVSQSKTSQLTNQLCDKLTNMKIANTDEKFAVYMNNVGRVTQELDDEYQKYLLNMKQQLVSPVHEFAHGSIENCKELKLKLKRKKGEYDMILKEEKKLRNKQHTKNINLANVHAIKLKSKQKLEKLELIRKQFLESVHLMDTERIMLLKFMQRFMASYGNYSMIFSEKMNANTDTMYYYPANLNNRLDLDSDTEDINDNSQTISRFNQWCKNTTVLKEGRIKKKGHPNKKFVIRWLKLFANKKMVFFEHNESNNSVKGHINLTKVISIVKKGGNTLEISTKSRFWILQFDSMQDRDIWHEVINGVAMTEAAMILQTINDNINIQSIQYRQLQYPTDDDMTTDLSHESLNEHHAISASSSPLLGAMPPALLLSQSSQSFNLNSSISNMMVIIEDKNNEFENETADSVSVSVSVSDRSVSIKPEETDKFLSLNEIVEHVTSPQIRGTQNQTVLMLTYCLYSTRHELLGIIFNRLLNTNDDPTHIKVFSLLRTWLKRENDFKNDLDETDGLSLFALHFSKQLTINIGDNQLFQKLAKPIFSQISMTSKDDENRVREMSLTSAPVARIPKIKNAKDLDLNKLDPTEVARQICLVEYDIFRKIKPEEFLKHKSKQSNKIAKLAVSNEQSNLSEQKLQHQILELKKTLSTNQEKESAKPNIDKIVDWFNKLVIWTQIEVLGQSELSQRVKILSNLLKICHKLEKYNNISSLCAIHAGLCSASIYRLHKTWDNIPKKSKEIKHKIDELFKLENNQKNLRDRISIMKQPAIPHIGLFLGDIIYIHDGNETFNKENGKINWNKMKLLADRINWISMFQQCPFVFQSVPIIMQYLESKMKIISEDFLYKLSRSVEPPKTV